MRSAFALVPLLALLACNGGNTIDETGETDADTDADTDSDTDADTDTDTDTDTDADTDVACEAEIDAVIPADNALGIATDASVEATFTAAVTDGQWSLEIDGVTGTATLATDGLSATFTPDAPLSNSTEYTINATACDDSVSATFETLPPPLDESILVGRTYGLAYADAEWKAPKSAALFSSQVDIEYVLTQVMDADETAETLTASGGVGETSSSGAIIQSPCYSIMNYGTVDFSSNPMFIAGPSDMSFPSDYGTITIEDMRIQAAFNTDASALVAIDMTGQIDTRPFDTSSQDVCTLAAYLGDTCEPCKSDGAVECLPVWIHADRADYIPGLDIDESYDPSTDTACN